MFARGLRAMRLCLALMAATAVTWTLVSHRDRPAPNPREGGVVFVYFPSLCANPGDPGACQEQPQDTRPAFESMAACSAFADRALKAAHNPRMMASCMKQWEG